MSININDYTANKSPGKFEGENPETEYFYGQMMEGDGDTIYVYYGEQVDGEYAGEAQADLFHINAEESEAFNLPIGHWFMIREDSQGFVFGSVHASRQEAEEKFRHWLGI